MGIVGALLDKIDLIQYNFTQSNNKDRKMSVYDYSVYDAKGNEVKLSDYKGKVLMIRIV